MDFAGDLRRDVVKGGRALKPGCAQARCHHGHVRGLIHRGRTVERGQFRVPLEQPAVLSPVCAHRDP